jgi:hypothetical protein
MRTSMCLLITFIVLGSLAISSAGLFLPGDAHPIWDVFASRRMLWDVSAAFSCGMFFVLAFALIDDMQEKDEGGFFEFSLYPFTTFLLLAVSVPPLALHGQLDGLRVVLGMMALMAWMLLHCVVMLFGWGSLALGVGLLALQCSGVAVAVWRHSFYRSEEPYYI